MNSSRINIDSSSTISGQKGQEKQQDYYYNNYTTRDQACSDGELPGQEIMQKIAEAYRANISQMITHAAAGIIEQALKHGMEPGTVILAIEETGMASRPSPYYLAAVLRNWAENGVVVSRSARLKIGTTEARPWWK